MKADLFLFDKVRLYSDGGQSDLPPLIVPLGREEYMKSFNGESRDELLNREIFTTLTEAKIVVEEWRKE